MSLPQHFEDGSTNPEWLRSRIGVMTGSRVANVAGHGFDKEFLKHMLWPSTHSVSRVFCDYGLKNEDRCEDVLRGYLEARVSNPSDPLVGFEIHHCGCVRSRSDRSRGYLPTGISRRGTQTDRRPCSVRVQVPLHQEKVQAAPACLWIYIPLTPRRPVRALGRATETLLVGRRAADTPDPSLLLRSGPVGNGYYACGRISAHPSRALPGDALLLRGVDAPVLAAVCGAPVRRVRCLAKQTVKTFYGKTVSSCNAPQAVRKAR